MEKLPTVYKKFFYLPNNAFNGYIKIYDDYIIIEYIGMSLMNWITDIRIEKKNIQKIIVYNDYKIPKFFKMFNSIFKAGKNFGKNIVIVADGKKYKLTILFDLEIKSNSIIDSIKSGGMENIIIEQVS